MAWAVWWALVLGFAISAIVQAWVPRERIQQALGGGGFRPIAVATGLGAASSSCSYAAIAIAKSLFQKGASAASALAFQFASTNLVVELGIVIWVLIGLAVHARRVRRWAGPDRSDDAAAAAVRLQAAGEGSPRPRPGRPTRVTSTTRPAAGRSGFASGSPRSPPGRTWRTTSATTGRWSTGRSSPASSSPDSSGCFPTPSSPACSSPTPPHRCALLENVIVGPIVAILSFVCSVGNIPLAAVLWSGGIGFGGVIAFIFADLLVLPIVAIYRKYYGTRFTVRIVALMFVTIVLAALAVDGLFGTAGLIPQTRPSRSGHLRLGHAELQAVHEHPRSRRLRRPVRVDVPPRRHRPRVRYAGRSREGCTGRARRSDPLLLLRALCAGFRREDIAPAGITRRAQRLLLRSSAAYSPPSRRPRRCITMIEPPAAISSSPPPTVQRRSKPVNGRVLAFAGSVAVVGVVLVVAGSTALVGVVGVFVDFDGEVPLFGSGFLAFELP